MDEDDIMKLGGAICGLVPGLVLCVVPLSLRMRGGVACPRSSSSTTNCGGYEGMNDGNRTGRRGGEGSEVCVGGLGYSAPKCGEVALRGEVEGKGIPWTLCKFGESESCDRAVAAKLARDDLRGMRAVCENGGFGCFKIEGWSPC